MRCWPPAVARLDATIRRLVIIPEGPLHRLPFDALRLRDGGYAAERYAISTAPSAKVLVSLWLHHPSGRPMRLLAFGDPGFASKRQPPLPRLRRSAGEARFVARYSPKSEVRLRGEASAAFLKGSDLTPFRVVHFATHTLVDEHTAARTALVLAPGKGESGFVGPDELARLRLDADMVVLSSCRSAGGVVINGEGVQGLIAPLFRAGARSVVATQWEVGDREAVSLVQALYRHLAQKRPVGEALRLAKLDAIRAKRSPYEWAAFTLVGDPLVQVPLRAPAWWQSSRLLTGLVALSAGCGAVLLAENPEGPQGGSETGTRRRIAHPPLIRRARGCRPASRHSKTGVGCELGDHRAPASVQQLETVALSPAEGSPGKSDWLCRSYFAGWSEEAAGQALLLW